MEGSRPVWDGRSGFGAGVRLFSPRYNPDTPSPQAFPRASPNPLASRAFPFNGGLVGMVCGPSFAGALPNLGKLPSSLEILRPQVQATLRWEARIG